MGPHATQVFLHNPEALRVEVLLDRGELKLWWSPDAGVSSEACWRNFSNRDDHLCVFESIRIEGFRLEDFEYCDYDAYFARIRFATGMLEIATVPDAPVVLLGADRPFAVAVATGRYDSRWAFSETAWEIRRVEPAGEFAFVAAVTPGAGKLLHQPIHEPWRRWFSRAEVRAGGVLAIGAGRAGVPILERVTELAAKPLAWTAENTRAQVAADLVDGLPQFTIDGVLANIYGSSRRSLHSAIDRSGAIRAAFKEIYYLIWLRDGAFCFNYQAASGWMHRHAEWCDFVCANPLEVHEPGVPPGRAFGQLVSRTYGKLEEDGIYYAVWSVFTQFVQGGRVASGQVAVLEEAMRWVEGYIFDSDRGLFGQHFADESPVGRSRDAGWDGAIGKPGGEPGIALDGRPIWRSYDCYINLLMFGAYGMLAALPDCSQPAGYRAKASALWEQVGAFLGGEGLPPYGELLLEDGSRVIAPPYRPSRSVYVWAFCLPGLAPIPGIDAIRWRLLQDVMAQPQGHWINGIAALVASLDTLVCGEDRLVEVLEVLAAQAERPGRFLPMGGAMPEKFDAVDGVYWDDIRPQAFAQSAFLAACTNLGVRRLPFGLAVRPTRTLKRLESYAWGESRIDFVLTSLLDARALLVNGEKVEGTLQIPDGLLRPGLNEIAHVEGGDGPCWVRSTVRLLGVRSQGGLRAYELEAFGLSEVVFDCDPGVVILAGDGMERTVEFLAEGPLWFGRFEAVGRHELRVRSTA